MGLQVSDCKKASSSRCSSYVDWDDQSLLPFGLARKATNVRYIETSVATRHGLSRQLFLNVANVKVSGFTVLNFKGASSAADKDIPVFFGTNGKIYWENPVGSGTVAELVPSLLTFSQNTYLQAACAYNRIHAATSDMNVGIDRPVVVDSAGNVDPLSMKRIGQPWEATRRYNIGDMISPTVGNGHLYRVTAVTTGLSGGAEPVWPVTDGGAVVNAGVTFTEYTYNASTVLPPPQAQTVATIAGAGALPAGLDVYIKITGVNQVGATTPGETAPIAAPFIKVTTVLNDRLQITGITDSSLAFSYLSTLAANFRMVGYNVYAASVATGAAAPANVAYKKQQAVLTVAAAGVPGASRAANVVTITTTAPHGFVAGQMATLAGIAAVGATGFNGNFVIASTPSGTTFTFAQNAPNDTGGGGTASASIPLATGFNLDTVATGTLGLSAISTAYLSLTPGNICSGTRYMFVLFRNRHDYVCGMSNFAPVQINVDAAGRQIFVGNIPIGPSNTTKRHVCFTVSGKSKAGPYTYIDQNDVDANGVVITQTTIADNATTSGYFNFTDVYLPTGVDVTDYFNKREVDPCVDIYFSKTMGRMVYTGLAAQPSAHYVSDPGDPETVTPALSTVAVADSDGDRTIAWRELYGAQYSLKGNSGHLVTPTDQNARDWDVVRKWAGSGPCSARAIDTVPGKDESQDQLIYAHRTGVFLFAGSSPMLISEEIVNFWKTINWSAQSTIWVACDPDSREVHIGVPVGNAVTPNKVLTVNYAEGWNKAYLFYPRRQGYVAIPGRKWAIQDINAYSALRIKRTLLASPEASQTYSQMMWASGAAADNGAVHMSVPGQLYDLLDGATQTPIDSQYFTTFGPTKSTAILAMHGIAMQVSGTGRASVVVRGQSNNPAPKVGPPTGMYPAKDVVFDEVVERSYTAAFYGPENHGFSIEITNKNAAGNGFELHTYDLFTKLRYGARA